MDSEPTAATGTTTDRELNWNPAAARSLSDKLGEPAELLARRLEALERLKHNRWPNRQQEAWRRTDPRKFSLREFHLWDPETPPPNPPTVGEPLPDAAAWLTLHNCRAVERGTTAGFDGKGVVFGALGEIPAGWSNDIVGNILNVADDHESPALTLTHLAYHQGGGYLELPAEVDLTGPVHIRHTTATPDGSIFPLTIIALGPQSRATVLLEQSAFGEEPSRFGGMTRLFIGDGAQLDLVVLNRADAAVRFYDHLHAQLGRDARLNLTWADLTDGLAVVRREMDAGAPGSESSLHGVHIGLGNGSCDLRTLQDHTAPATVSDLLYKAVLFGKSRSVYQGLITVTPEAPGANAYQLNRNLLMSGGAHADSIPKLEIAVDEVRCTHGASSGRVDPESLFYLMSRGMSRTAATRLLVEGFLGAAADLLPEGGLRQRWLEAVADRTAGIL